MAQTRVCDIITVGGCPQPQKNDDAGSVTTRAVLFGDTDLDGGVLIGDFNVFAPNFGSTSGKVWADGSVAASA